METLDSWNHLERYGVVPLTREACGLSYRLLCDLTEPGARIVEKALSTQISRGNNWNHGAESNPHVASLMVTLEMFPLIAVFAALENGFREVELFKAKNNSIPIVVAFTDEDLSREDIQAIRSPDYLTWLGWEHLRTFTYGGTAGDRNVHEMSGRVS